MPFYIPLLVTNIAFGIFLADCWLTPRKQKKVKGALRTTLYVGLIIGFWLAYVIGLLIGGAA